VPEAERSITINRPVADVFAFLADGLTATKWRSGVLDIAHVSGDGLGAIYRQGVKGPMGRRIAADYRITEYTPTKRIAFEAIAGPVRPRGAYVMEPGGDGTRLTFSLAAKLGPVQRLVMGRMVQQTMDAEIRALDTLKTVLED
jgi:carbon monoxide dehydrogenase subunit G